MTEKITSDLQTEKFSSDKERLDFLQKSIIECVKKIRKDFNENFSNILEAKTRELGIDPEQLPRRYGREKTKLRRDTQYSRNKKIALIDGLDSLRKEFEQNPMLKDYTPEFNALIDVMRTMFLSQLHVRHKEYKVMVDAPQLQDDEIQEQESLTEDMTESRALIQWYVLQNEHDPEYLKSLFSTFQGSMEELEFKKAWWGVERGLRQEIGVSKLLKKYFNKVTLGEPKEDAHHAIDFWAETKNGTTIIFQSKSTSAFSEDGVYGEQDIDALEKKLSANPYAHVDLKYKRQFDNNEPPTPLVKLKKLQQDIQKAKEYAKNKGIGNPVFYLISCNANNFEDITGNPTGFSIASVSDRLDKISKTE